MPDDAIAYDAFVSYRHQEPDKTWVRRTLVPALDAAGLRVCVDHRDFALGAPILEEMAQAVERSRCTVAVLTPAYLAGRFGMLENVLAEHLGLEEGARRLLYVKRAACEPPLRVRARLYLDMSDDAEVAAALERLVAELRSSTAS